jgi:hypothetical protein
MSVMRAPEAWADDRVFTVEDLESGSASAPIGSSNRAQRSRA